MQHTAGQVARLAISCTLRTAAIRLRLVLTWA